MKLQKWLNIVLTFSSFCVIASGAYLVYSSNMFGLKQNAIQSQRKVVIQDRRVKKISAEKLKKEVTNNVYKNKGWNRLGVVTIPFLNISLPIYDHPYDEQALAKGAQHLNAVNKNQISVDGSIGSGNYILVAHNYNDGKTMFSALQQNLNKDAPYLVNNSTQTNNWLSGKKVYVANDQGIYEYTIDDQKAIKGIDTSVRQNTEQAKLSIITCLFPSDQYRIDTEGTLTNYWSWSMAPQSVLQKINIKFNLKGSR